MRSELEDKWVVETSVGAAEPFHLRPFPASEEREHATFKPSAHTEATLPPTSNLQQSSIRPTAELSFQPTIWIHQVQIPALVLGSRQTESVLDAVRARASGYEVSRRRSGGGVVLVQPNVSCWIDVLLPKGHRLWVDDISVAFHWVGELWAQTLADLGVTEIEVHRGGIVNAEQGRSVCFAGLGPGEVLVGGRKVVGLSQRRTRDGARFQCLLLSTWDSAPLTDFLFDDELPSDLDLGQVRAGHSQITLEVVAAAPSQFVHNLQTRPHSNQD